MKRKTIDVTKDGEERKKRRYLSIDPGTSTFSFAYCTYNQKSPEEQGEEWTFEPKWAKTIDLGKSVLTKSSSRSKTKNFTDTEASKMYALQIEDLISFFETDADMMKLTSKSVDLDVLPENQDGCYDPAIFHNLMRANFLSAAFCSALRVKHSGTVKFHFVAKTYKYGTKLTNKIIKNSNCRGTKKEKEHRRTIRKSVACAVGRLLLNSCSSLVRKKCLAERPDTAFNHVADCMSQAYRFAKEVTGHPASVGGKKKRRPAFSEPNDPKDVIYIENYVREKHPSLFNETLTKKLADFNEKLNGVKKRARPIVVKKSTNK